MALSGMASPDWNLRNSLEIMANEIRSNNRSKIGSKSSSKSYQKLRCHPPWILRLLLKMLLNPTEYLEFTDDLNEVYQALVQSEGKTKGRARARPLNAKYDYGDGCGSMLMRSL